MIITKNIFHALFAAIRKELTIQKPDPAKVQQPYMSTRKPVNYGDAAKGFMLMIIVPIILFALSILVL